MKSRFSYGLMIITMTACSGLTSFAQTHKAKAPVKKTTIAKKPTLADLQQGKELLLKSDCLSCHKPDVKMIGPAYKDVAAKYTPTEANYNLLTKKVIAGGSGVWGQVAMAPHPAIPPADVKKMVEYVLSIK